jgi:hypothetical protein
VSYRNGRRESLFSYHVVKELHKLILRIVKERFCPDEGISGMVMQILSNYLNGQSICRYIRESVRGLGAS